MVSRRRSIGLGCQADSIYNSRRPRTGAVLVYMSVSLIAFAAFTSLAVDVARVELAKNQLTFDADAGAHAAAAAFSADPSTASAAATAIFSACPLEGTSLVSPGTLLEFGTWNFSSRVFTPSSLTAANAARVKLSLASANNNAVPLFFASLIGQKTCDVHAGAVAFADLSNCYSFVGIDSFSAQGLLTVDSYPGGARGSVASNGDVKLDILGLIGLTRVDGDVHPGVGQTIQKPLISILTKITGATSNLGSTLYFPPVNDTASAAQNSNSLLPSWAFDGTNLTAALATTIPTGTYEVNDFTILANVLLNVNGPVTIYVKNNCTILGNVLVSGNTAANFKIRMVNSGAVTIAATTALYADLYGPQSSVTLLAGLGYSGRIIAKNINVIGTSILHADESLVTGPSVYLVQ